MFLIPKDKILDFDGSEKALLCFKFLILFAVGFSNFRGFIQCVKHLFLEFLIHPASVRISIKIQQYIYFDEATTDKVLLTSAS